MEIRRRRTMEIRSGIQFSIGLGGYFDGIVLHRILQWRHMLSNEGDYPADTVEGLQSRRSGMGCFTR